MSNLMSMNFKLINLKLIVLFSALYSFLCFFVLVKSYRKKKTNKQTNLITSSTLLLQTTPEKKLHLISAAMKSNVN